MPLIDIVIPGYAAPLAAPGPIAETFKRAVADAARCVWQGPFVKKPCAVRLTYDLDDGRYATTALFNLLKSVIDGLGHVAFAPAHGGSGKWHIDGGPTNLFGWNGLLRYMVALANGIGKTIGSQNYTP
ncbi:MAG TPA: hypothetical protein VFE42_31485 [Chloroflexota bacterium]|nr:hypothetical protein [Chloroflexota bacterium]